MSKERLALTLACDSHYAYYYRCRGHAATKAKCKTTEFQRARRPASPYRPSVLSVPCTLRG